LIGGSGDKMKSEMKKSVQEFIRDENGLITKNNILKMGLATGMAAILVSGVSHAADHTSHQNELTSADFNGSRITATHGHHASHTSSVT